MKTKWFNVSCFLITTEKGVRSITDPYQYNYKPADPPPEYEGDRPPVAEIADVVTISHPHADHSYVWSITGLPQLYNGGANAEIKGVKFSGVATLHDNYGAPGGVPMRGPNGLIGIEVDGIKIWHMGDFGLQKKLYDEQLAKMVKADILMTPWDMPEAIQNEVLSQLKPKVVFPMHHVRVNDYMRSFKGFTDYTQKTSEVEFTAKSLPSEMQVIMLKPALEY